MMLGYKYKKNLIFGGRFPQILSLNGIVLDVIQVLLCTANDFS